MVQKRVTFYTEKNRASEIDTQMASVLFTPPTFCSILENNGVRNSQHFPAALAVVLHFHLPLLSFVRTFPFCYKLMVKLLVYFFNLLLQKC